MLRRCCCLSFVFCNWNINLIYLENVSIVLYCWCFLFVCWERLSTDVKCIFHFFTERNVIMSLMFSSCASLDFSIFQQSCNCFQQLVCNSVFSAANEIGVLRFVLLHCFYYVVYSVLTWFSIDPICYCICFLFLLLAILMHCVISLGLYCPLVQLLEQVFVIIIIIFAGLSPITNIPISATDVFVNVHTVIQNEWQSRWNLHPNNKLYKIYPNVYTSSVT